MAIQEKKGRWGRPSVFYDDTDTDLGEFKTRQEALAAHDTKQKSGAVTSQNELDFGEVVSNTDATDRTGQQYLPRGYDQNKTVGENAAAGIAKEKDKAVSRYVPGGNVEATQKKVDEVLGGKVIPAINTVLATPISTETNREPQEDIQSEPAYNADGWYQDKNGKWIPGPNAKYEGTEEGSATGDGTQTGEGEAAEEGTAEEVVKEVDEVAPTPEDKNDLQKAAKRVLGLTGDKKKDAMKWLAVAISAAAHGARGEPSPVVQMIMDDYQAKRTQNTNIEDREDRQEFDRETNEWNKATDTERMKLANDLAKDFASFGLPLDVKRAEAMSSVDYNAMMRIRKEIERNPDQWAKTSKAQNGMDRIDMFLRNTGLVLGGLSSLRGLFGGGN